MEISFENYYSGTSGLILPLPNKLHYPEAFQDKSRLCYYASLMNSIEINSSFYKIPLASTVSKWAADVPEHFKFTFKLFKEITHSKGLAFNGEILTKFFKIIAQVHNKKGCLLVQFPPSIRIRHISNLALLMSSLRENDLSNEWNIALEFRHQSLYVDEVYELLNRFELGMVVHDKSPASSPLMETGCDFRYLRFHGPDGNYRNSYNDEVLAEYATYIKEWLKEEKKVFVYFNNTMGAAHANLNTLSKFVKDGTA